MSEAVQGSILYSPILAWMPPRPRPINPVKLLSFSGGGWNTHSHLAGATAASMDWQQNRGSERSLNDLLEKYDYISANSGGTWFLSFLGFSPDYLNSLESRQRADQYTTHGFIRQARTAFNTIYPFFTRPETFQLKYLVDHYGPNWNALVQALVYDPIMYGLQGQARVDNNITEKRFVSSQLQDWAKGKRLTFATQMLKRDDIHSTFDRFQPPISPIRRHISGFDYWAYSGYHGSAETGIGRDMQGSSYYPLSIEIKKRGEPNNNRRPNVSGQSESIYRVPSAYDPERNLISDLYISYESSEIVGPDGQNNYQSLFNSFPGEGVATQNAASAPSIVSSAAPSFRASPDWYPLPLSSTTPKKNRLAAPIAQFGNDENMQVGMRLLNEYDYNPRLNAYRNFEQVRDQGYMRLGDGGNGDNSSLAFNLSAAVREGYKNGDTRLTVANPDEDERNRFEATLFHNNTSSLDSLVAVPNGSGTRLPSDVLALFGADGRDRDPNSDWLYKNDDLGPVSLWEISPQIFSTDSLTGLQQPNWQYQAPGNEVHLQYWKIKVRTIGNPNYGIIGDIWGEFELFLSLNPPSNAMPWKNEINDLYADNYNAWRNAYASFSDSYDRPFLTEM